MSAAGRRLATPRAPSLLKLALSILAKMFSQLSLVPLARAFPVHTPVRFVIDPWIATVTQG